MWLSDRFQKGLPNVDCEEFPFSIGRSWRRADYGSTQTMPSTSKISIEKEDEVAGKRLLDLTHSKRRKLFRRSYDMEKFTVAGISNLKAQHKVLCERD